MRFGMKLACDICQHYNIQGGCFNITGPIIKQKSQFQEKSRVMCTKFEVDLSYMSEVKDQTWLCVQMDEWTDGQGKTNTHPPTLL